MKLSIRPDVILCWVLLLVAKHCFGMPSKAHCKQNEFTCDDKNCISIKWKCDGQEDCMDGSDERNCSLHCKGSEFQCDDKSCILKQWKCDGDNDCGDGSDERNCATNCSSTEFTCADRRRCIAKIWRCDGAPDCEDNSDETGCPAISCSSSQLMCENRSCFPIRWRCDGQSDCPDGSDEKNCSTKTVSCTLSQFTCTSNKCIPKNRQCDGRDDCSDGSDEQNCEKTKTACGPNYFGCEDGKCVSRKFRCDGQNDCINGTDEANCNNTRILCPRGQFRCDDGICIPKSFLCDDENDCVDESDETSCSDPCSEYGFCSQICTNAGGVTECSCNSMYSLQQNGRSCKAKGEKPFILYTNRQDVRRATTENTETAMVADGLQVAYGLAYDSFTKRLYISDLNQFTIFEKSLNTSEKYTEFLKLNRNSTVEGLAVDWVGRKLYWTDKGLGKVCVAELDGKHSLTLASKNLDLPRSIAIDPTENGRHIYWTDWGGKGKIEKMSMDGDPDTRFTLHNLLGSWPNGISIDLIQRRLYWTDGMRKVIESSRLDGTDRKKILEMKNQHLFSISIFEDYMYWTDFGDAAIFRANRFTGKDFKKFPVHTTILTGMTIYHPAKQIKAINPCNVNNGGCSHLCLLSSKHGYTCRCPDGSRLLTDKRTCKI